MVRFRLASACAIVGLGCGVAAALPPNVTREQVVGGLNQPIAIGFLPDGRMLILEKPGQIVLADISTLPATVTPYLTLTDIDTGGYERGLIDIAMDPDFDANGYIYLYYSRISSMKFGISRFTDTGGATDPASEVRIWEDNEPFSSHSHYGGGLDFGPDGKLYLTTGDEFDPTQPQDLGRAGGKIIRINKDGTIPLDNPFVDGPGGNLDEIWAYGLRNAFRSKWDRPGDRFFVGEVGGNDQNTAWEDVYIAHAGENYGWPDCEGACDNPDYTDPVYTYPHLGVPGCLIGGFAYRGAQLPSEYYGAYFFADYSRGWVKYLTFDASGTTVASETEFDPGVAGQAIVDLEPGPDGSIYYSDFNGGGIWRFVYDAGNQPPTIDQAGASEPSGSAPVTVSFTGSATDPEGDALNYLWRFGDGQESTSASVDHTYAANGRYTAYFQVSDPTHIVLSSPISVQVGEPPAATIEEPADGTMFRAGDVINYAGSATDPDGSLGPDNYSWTVRFVQGGHEQGPLGPTSGANGSFTIPTSNQDFTRDARYEIILTVTDADGLTDQTSVMIYPEKVNLTVDSNPQNAPILFDGMRRTTPFVEDSLIGFDHTVTAPGMICLGQGEYVFEGWSDGGAATHVVTTPDHDSTITAQLNSTGDPCVLPVQNGLVAWYNSDQGVTVTGGMVTQWSDQSPSGLDLFNQGQPQLVPDAINGHPSILLDGVDDVMERIGALSQLPANDADRTMIAVVKYNGVGFGGLTYGNDQCNQVFGLSVSPDGLLMVHGWCGENDFISSAQGTGAGWIINEVVYGNDMFEHYRDGELINAGSHVYGTNPARIVLGAEIDTSPHVALEVAELFIFNRALSTTERVDMENYLEQRYFTPPCPYDIDGSPGVDVFDLLAYLSLWFDQDPAADIDGAAGVDVFDLLAYLNGWFPASEGQPCP